ncbi:YegP family protein [Pseudophaeobacter sp. C1-32P7]|uniref:YegP family protein n=1 Tax=Pseudophaeobacter sp. C1-32P7 TaxID=3098142 RepID=UPI0034D56355
MFYELYKDQAGYWRWTLFAANYRKIANSGEGYFNKGDAIAAINLVKSSSPAPVRETSRV